MCFSVGAIAVEACFTNHPGVCVGYRLSTSGGTIVYMPDNETFSSHVLAGNGNIMPCTLESKLVEFVRDADVLIVDGQYSAREYESHVGWGHGCVDEVIRLAMAADVRRLYLFHHDPAHDDKQLATMLAHARQIAHSAGSALRVDAAREGEQVALAVDAALAVASG